MDVKGKEMRLDTRHYYSAYAHLLACVPANALESGLDLLPDRDRQFVRRSAFGHWAREDVTLDLDTSRRSLPQLRCGYFEVGSGSLRMMHLTDIKYHAF